MSLTCKNCGRIFDIPYFMPPTDFCSPKCKENFLKAIAPRPEEKCNSQKEFDFQKEMNKLKRKYERERLYRLRKKERKQNER